MIVFTAKFNRKKALLLIIALAVVLCAVILLAGGSGDAADAGSFTAVVKSDDDRVAFLRSLGWEVSDTPVEEQTVLIPTDFSGAYSDYNDLQLTQGFDLSKYGGLEAVRYTYEVYNHPDSTDTVVADILVYRNEVIGGDVKSTSLDGFMQGLAYPGGQQEA